MLPLAPILALLLLRAFISLLAVSFAGVIWSAGDGVIRADHDSSTTAAIVLTFVVGLLDTLGIAYLVSSRHRRTATRARFLLLHYVSAGFWLVVTILVTAVIPTSNGVGATTVLCGRSAGCQSSRLLYGIDALAFLTLIVIAVVICYAFLRKAAFSYPDPAAQPENGLAQPSSSEGSSPMEELKAPVLSEVKPVTSQNSLNSVASVPQHWHKPSSPDEPLSNANSSRSSLPLPLTVTPPTRDRDYADSIEPAGPHQPPFAPYATTSRSDDRLSLPEASRSLEKLPSANVASARSYERLPPAHATTSRSFEKLPTGPDEITIPPASRLADSRQMRQREPRRASRLSQFVEVVESPTDATTPEAVPDLPASPRLDKRLSRRKMVRSGEFRVNSVAKVAHTPDLNAVTPESPASPPAGHRWGHGAARIIAASRRSLTRSPTPTSNMSSLQQRPVYTGQQGATDGRSPNLDHY